MLWSAQKRLDFIEARLFWEGQLSRQDIQDFFKISRPQATKDLNRYIEIAPGNMQYDKSAKYYVATKNFEPKISKPSSDRYLSRLRLLHGNKNRNVFFSGTIPSFAEMPQLKRFVDEDVLKGVLTAINNQNAIKIKYQSISHPKPKIRWITPHSLAHNGFRWHIRALCHNDNIYKEFVLGRIFSIENSMKQIFDHSFDYEWHQEISVKIAPNPQLNETLRALIERDYCMKNGEVTISMKAAFTYYFLRRFGFGEDDKDPIEKEVKQIVILNLDEINTKVGLLKSMSKTKINELIKNGSYMGWET